MGIGKRRRREQWGRKSGFRGLEMLKVKWLELGLSSEGNGRGRGA